MQTSLGANSLAMTPLLLAGSEALRRRYLEQFAASPVLASFCLTEPAAGSDVAAISTRAVRRGSAYVISGSKCFITNGGYADVYVVFAKTDPQAGHRGISCFLVPRDAGVVAGGHEDKMGQRASNTSTVTFPDVEIPADHLIGEENAGFRIAMATLDRTRPGAAAMATGVARAAYEFAVSYARERDPVRRPDRLSPGDPVHDRRHGHRDRRGPPAHLALGGRDRWWCPRDARVLSRQALRRGRRDAREHRRRPGVRRLRLYQGLPGREADARREDPAALRGHRPDPAHRDRPRDLRAHGRRTSIGPL